MSEIVEFGHRSVLVCWAFEGHGEGECADEATGEGSESMCRVVVWVEGEDVAGGEVVCEVVEVGDGGAWEVDAGVGGGAFGEDAVEVGGLGCEDVRGEVEDCFAF